jgi:hypothetical protein
MTRVYDAVAGVAFYSLIAFAVSPSLLHGQGVPVVQFDRLPPAPAFVGQTRAPAPAEPSAYSVSKRTERSHNR